MTQMLPNRNDCTATSFELVVETSSIDWDDGITTNRFIVYGNDKNGRWVEEIIEAAETKRYTQFAKRWLGSKFPQLKTQRGWFEKALAARTAEN